jgi:4-carboxymuconolactone decarboxylase
VKPYPNHERVVRRTSRDTVGDVQRVLGKLEANGLDLTINKLLANCSTAFRPFVLFSGALLHQGVMPPWLRELTIMRIAARRGLSYEWLEHLPIAQRAGLTAEQIESIRSGRLDSIDMSDQALLAVRISDQLTTPPCGITADDFEAATQAWGIEGALELILIVGWWGGFVATLVNGLGLTAPDGVVERPFD